MITDTHMPITSMEKTAAVKVIVILTGMHIHIRSMVQSAAVEVIIKNILTIKKKMRREKKKLFPPIEKAKRRRIFWIILDERTVLPRWKQGFRRCLR